jgi:hypothetical protein
MQDRALSAASGPGRGARRRGRPLPADVVAAGEGVGCAAGRPVEPGDRLAVELAEAAADGQVGHHGQGGVDGGRCPFAGAVQVRPRSRGRPTPRRPGRSAGRRRRRRRRRPATPGTSAPFATGTLTRPGSYGVTDNALVVLAHSAPRRRHRYRCFCPGCHGSLRRPGPGRARGTSSGQAERQPIAHHTVGPSAEAQTGYQRRGSHCQAHASRASRSPWS